MDQNKLMTASHKKPSAKEVIVALLTIHGLFLIIIGLMAFFGGFIGAYEVSHGRTTPGAVLAVLGGSWPGFFCWKALFPSSVL